MRTRILLILVTGMFIASCQLKTETVEYGTLLDRGGKKYKPNTEEPFTGSEVKVYKNAQKAIEIKYKEGVPIADEKWYENGQKKEIVPYNNGKKEGVMLKFYENGQKQEELKFADDKAMGLHTTWHKNGQKKSEASFLNGIKEKTETGWFESGEKQYEKSYTKGKAEGKAYEFYKNGKVYKEYEYKNDVINGIAFEYDKAGKVKDKVQYRNGVAGLPDDYGASTANIDYKKEIGKFKTTAEWDNIVFRNDIAYFVNKSKPYTGKRVKYYQNKQTEALQIYLKGKLYLGFNWFYNGQMESVCQLLNDKEHGNQISWYENGQKKSLYQYKNGEFHGTYREWYENGQKKEISSYLNGKYGNCSYFRMNGEKYTLKFINGVPQVEMIKVEGGTFQMGSNDGDKDEKPVHTVKLDGFYIAKYEVTKILRHSVMFDSFSSNLGGYPASFDNYVAVEGFIDELNKLTGKKYRLPTEAEWEYAARGGNRSKGYKYAGSNNVDEVASIKEYIVFVGSKKPNELGIYDMSGNELELCSDWYASDYYSRSVINNPKGASNGSRHVSRGSSNSVHDRYNKNQYRSTHRSGVAGFRSHGHWIPQGYGIRLAHDL